MKKTQYLLAGVLVSGAFALTGCGGSDEAAGVTASSITVEGAVGQTASIGAKGALATEALNDNTYYARYAYCNNDNCSQSTNGLMHFTLNNTGNKIASLMVDASGKVTVDSDDIPHYTSGASGTVSLANSSLTPKDAEKRIYNLQLNTSSSVESKVQILMFTLERTVKPLYLPMRTTYL